METTDTNIVSNLIKPNNNNNYGSINPDKQANRRAFTEGIQIDDDQIEAIDINNLTDDQLRELARRAGYEIDEFESLEEDNYEQNDDSDQVEQNNQNKNEMGDSDVDDIDFENFKGIYFGDDPNKKYTCPVTGAHFEYYDLCKRMISLKELRVKIDKELGIPDTERSQKNQKDQSKQNQEDFTKVMINNDIQQKQKSSKLQQYNQDNDMKDLQEIKFFQNNNNQQHHQQIRVETEPNVDNGKIQSQDRNQHQLIDNQKQNLTQISDNQTLLLQRRANRLISITNKNEIMRLQQFNNLQQPVIPETLTRMSISKATAQQDIRSKSIEKNQNIKLQQSHRSNQNKQNQQQLQQIHQQNYSSLANQGVYHRKQLSMAAAQGEVNFKTTESGQEFQKLQEFNKRNSNPGNEMQSMTNYSVERRSQQTTGISSESNQNPLMSANRQQQQQKRSITNDKFLKASNFEIKSRLTGSSFTSNQDQIVNQNIGGYNRKTRNVNSIGFSSHLQKKSQNFEQYDPSMTQPRTQSFKISPYVQKHKYQSITQQQNQEKYSSDVPVFIEQIDQFQIPQMSNINSGNSRNQSKHQIYQNKAGSFNANLKTNDLLASFHKNSNIISAIKSGAGKRLLLGQQQNVRKSLGGEQNPLLAINNGATNITQIENNNKKRSLDQQSIQMHLKNISNQDKSRQIGIKIAYDFQNPSTGNQFVQSLNNNNKIKPFMTFYNSNQIQNPFATNKPQY
eukprot:403333160